jgi:hypothetical protein
MNTTESNVIGMCTVCQTIHVSDKGFSNGRECENCGEESVYSLNEISDIVNDYFVLKADWDTMMEQLDD